MKIVDELYREWQNLQPLSSQNKSRLEQKFMLEFNYNSNHLEGNSLTYGQTKLLLMFGQTSGEAKLRDYEEMKAHNVGLELMKREARDKERPLTENFIRELNRTILVEDFRKITGGYSYEIRVGQYKTRPNSVITSTGETFDYASPEETPALMTDLVNWYNEEEKKGELDPIQLAALFHYRYIRIHSFEDGNGRVARLLVNYILLRHDYPMVIVHSSDKENYLNVLHVCDVEVGFIPSDGANASLEQIGPFVEYMENRLIAALEISIKAAKGESIEEEDDFAKQLTLLEREAKSKKDNIKLTKEHVWKVLEFFYFPTKEKIVESLQPATKFFSRKSSSYKISEGQKTTAIRDLEKNITLQLKDYLSNATALTFYYNLNDIKKEYEMNNLSIRIEFSIVFEENYYLISSLDNKKYKYETYPANEEVNKMILQFKTEVLSKIEKAIRKEE